MKKNNRKGFTIVELVIVIAVIAILAGVLIPTFSGIVKKAQESAALQEAQNAFKIFYAEELADGEIEDKAYTSGDYTFTIENGKLKEATITGGSFTFTVDTTNGVISGATKS